MGALKRQGVMTLAEVAAKAERGPHVARIAGTISAKQERKSARGNRFAFVQASDPTGLYEVTVFSETLEKHRQHLEAGMRVILTVQAELEADQLKMLVRGAQPIDEAVAQPGGAMGLRIYVEAVDAVSNVASLLKRMSKEAGAARGSIELRLMTESIGGEVDISLGDRLPVSPQFKSALKAVPGVLTVEEV
jgi:DNA polymerase-3 subunit alpha